MPRKDLFENPWVNVIHMEECVDRMKQFDKQAEEQGFYYHKHPGIVVGNIPFAGVNMAHKSIVKKAKESSKPMVIIAEDDCVFSAPGAYDYYLANMPAEFDLYLGMIYSGDIVDGMVKNYMAGLTLYTVHERFYDKFLAMPVMNHIDRLLGNLANYNDFHVCDPFVCEQSDGWSFHKKEEGKYKHLVADRIFFGR